MKLTWPALKATLTPHTVDTPRGTLAGFLVRCTASGKELGYVWQAGAAWRWRTPDRHYGERSTQRAAVQVLRDAHELRRDGLPFEHAPVEPRIVCPPLKPLKPKAPPLVPPTAPLSKTRPPLKRTAIPLPASFPEQPPSPPEPPAAEPPRIVWSRVPGVTEALEAALKRRG